MERCFLKKFKSEKFQKLFNKLAKNAKKYIETKFNKEIYIKKLNQIYKKWKK